MQQHGPADEVLYLLQQVGGQQDGFVGFQNTQQHLVKVLPVEDVVAGEGLIHQDVVGALTQGQDHLKLVLLAGGKPADGLVGRQLEEVQQSVEAFLTEGRKLAGEKNSVLLCGQVGEEGVLAGGEGQAGDVGPVYRSAVQGDLALIG